MGSHRSQDNGINATKAYKLIDEFIQMLKKALQFAGENT
jgi:hypothetical protein